MSYTVGMGSLAEVQGQLRMANQHAAHLEAERDAALAVIEQMREAKGPSGDCLSDFAEDQWWFAEIRKAVEFGTEDQKRAVAVVRNLLSTAQTALALKPDLTALRKRDAETLRKAAGEFESRAHVVVPQELRRMADRIETGGAL